MVPRRGVSSVLVTVITVLALALVLAFLWRVYGYFRQIRSGVVSLPQFSSSFSASGRLDGAAAVGAEIATVDDPSTGPKDAKLTVVEFLDYQCPYCNQVSSTVRELTSTYGDRVRFVIRDFPVIDIHPDAAYAAEAAGCAEAQGKFWQMHDRLFALKGQLQSPDLERAAEQSGLDAAAYRTCMQTRSRVDEIEADLRAGVAAGVRGTPTFFFNGQKVEGAIPKDVFQRLIDASLGN
jgi:protein-disulfide isomerase